MKQKLKAQNHNQQGNALIYVLIAIVLFAALSFTLGRQTDTGETSIIDEGQAEVLANRIINYAAQAESALAQMTFGGTRVANIDFIRPSEVGFNAVAVSGNINKIYHPQGGGLTPGELPSGVIGATATTVDAGWYLGRFNDVEWSESTNDDVMLSAVQISEQICEKINEKISGSTTIPAIPGGTTLVQLFVPPGVHGGAAADLTAVTCPGCEGYSSLCVEKGGTYVYYTMAISD